MSVNNKMIHSSEFHHVIVNGWVLDLFKKLFENKNKNDEYIAELQIKFELWSYFIKTFLDKNKTQKEIKHLKYLKKMFDRVKIDGNVSTINGYRIMAVFYQLNKTMIFDKKYEFGKHLKILLKTIKRIRKHLKQNLYESCFLQQHVRNIMKTITHTHSNFEMFARMNKNLSNIIEMMYNQSVFFIIKPNVLLQQAVDYGKQYAY
jgi:hypothetical protein